jgi:hypothetical protein
MANQFGTLLQPTTVTGAQSSCGPDARYQVKSFQGMVTGSGSLSATLLVQASNMTTPTLNGHWVTLGTITLSGSTAVSDGFASEAPWQWYRGNVQSMSNASAVAQILVGY